MLFDASVSASRVQQVAHVPSGAGGTTQGAAFPLFEDIRGEFLTAAVVDRGFGATLTPGGAGARAMETEALAQAPFLDAANETVRWLALDDEILEIRVATKTQVEIIRSFDSDGSIYLYAAFDPEKGRYFDLVQMRMKMIELAFGL